MALDTEAVDLLTLTRDLERMLESKELREGYLDGKTVLRDGVMSLLGCSQLEAERIVDTLEARSFIRFGWEPGDASDGAWHLHTLYR